MSTNKKLKLLLASILTLTAINIGVNFSLAQDLNQEKITSFHSQITVQSDSSLLVSETISVIALGDQIQRGIYRDFPTYYQDRFGNNYNVGFEVLTVTRDGQPETYHIENVSNGKRIYIGKSDYFLQPGRYTYVITYKTTRQLGFFADHDELYWNVTGQGWVFPIDQASAKVILPEGIPTQKIISEGYTGAQNSKGKDFSLITSPDGSITFQTTKGLISYEGLTIVVGWPKGYVTEPGTQEKIEYFYQDNRGLIAAGLGLLFIFLYYLTIWSKVGKDPAKGTIIPQYEPPLGMSAGLIRYLSQMKFDNKIFVAQLIEMAVKGLIKIKEQENQGLSRLTEGRITYSAEKLSSSSITTAMENKILEKLFGSNNTIEFKNKNYKKIQSATKELKKDLEEKNNDQYFKINNKYLIPGIILSILILVSTFWAQLIDPFSGLSLFIIIFLPFIIFNNLYRLKKSGNKFALIYGTIVLILVSAAVIPKIISLANFLNIPNSSTSGSVTVILFGILILINYIFSFLLKAPTLDGRRILDQIEGFKWFLTVTEKDRLNFHNPPEKTPELFEKFLPYAIALGVEHRWSEQFSQVFARLSEQGSSYVPNWYFGSHFSTSNVSGFSSSLSGTFAGAIAASAAAPGSSSGFGGGGGAGGGGGGGGGGGW